MINKKKITGLFLVSLLSLSMLMVSCSKEKQGTGVSSADDGVVNISFWHMAPEGDKTFELFDNMVNEFNEKNPGIHLEHMGVNFWDYWTKLSTSIAGGTGPDIAFNIAESLQARIDEGSLANLSEYFELNNFDTSNNITTQFEYMSDADGNLRAYPYGSSVRVLYYDKDMFVEAGLDPEKPPRTWAEAEEYGKILTKYKDGNKDLVDVIGFDPAMGNCFLWNIAWNNGGRFFDDDLNPTVNSPENIEALEWMVNIHQGYGIKALSSFLSQSASLSVDPFVAGKMAMMISVESIYDQIKRHAPDKNIGVAPVPFQKKRVNWSSGFTLELFDNGDKEETDAAWKFFEELISPEGQQAYFKKTGWIMTDKSVGEMESVKNDPIMQAILTETEFAQNRVYVKEAQSWHVTITPEIDAALLGTKTPTEALNAAQKLLETEIANYKATH